MLPSDSAAQWARWKRVLARRRLPAALVDLDAVDHNARVLRAALARAAPPGADRPPTLRLASKSLRCPALLRHILGLDPAFQGLLTMSAHETLALADQGFDDLFLAYPASRPDEAAALAQVAARGLRLVATVDSPAHVALLSAAAQEVDAELAVAIDVDMSLRPGGLSAAHLGVRRSPVRGPADALAVAAACRTHPGVRLAGLLAYEAQVAGIPDTTPGSRALDPVRGLLKRRSIPLARNRRAEVQAALRTAGHDIQVVNGGGTGSVLSTAADPTVTEVTAGSGFLCPHLFDGYAGLPLQPAAFFALSVCRQSDPGFVTCFGGGYPASGAMGPDRLPQAWLPAGLKPLDLEGWGEVQTPFSTRGCDTPLGLGDPVLCRHAKAGELAERFGELLLVRGEEVVEVAPTYRGLGFAFG
ncbi:alanine racemase [Myxococcota bacterium]|nr:alanine racemase [Myxococcota bacterium]